MSQSFKMKFNQMREGNPTNLETSVEHHAKAYDVFYNKESHARNICLVWPDGKRKFLNYNDLISGEYLPDESTLTLVFTAQAFVLKGVNLENLFYEVMNYAVRQIICVDERYNLIGENEKFVVNSVDLKKITQ